MDETIVSSSICFHLKNKQNKLCKSNKQTNLRTSIPGNGVTSEPTAKRIFLALRVSFEPSSFFTET